MLETHAISKRFGGVTAVDDVSLEVSEGAIVGLIGTNGAGKTTLFNVISGYLRADGGCVIFDGEDISNCAPYESASKGLLRTFQTPIGFQKLTVMENMLVFQKNQDTSIGHALWSPLNAGSVAPETAERIDRILSTFGLAAKQGTWVHDLAAPELKMLEFARTLMADPKILLLDEPAAGVNPALLEQLVFTIEDFRRSGVTFLIVDHNLRFICQVCDHIYAMADGRVISSGTPDAVVNDMAVIECYIGKGLKG